MNELPSPQNWREPLVRASFGVKALLINLQVKKRIYLNYYKFKTNQNF